MQPVVDPYEKVGRALRNEEAAASAHHLVIVRSILELRTVNEFKGITTGVMRVLKLEKAQGGNGIKCSVVQNNDSRHEELATLLKKLNAQDDGSAAAKGSKAALAVPVLQEYALTALREQFIQRYAAVFSLLSKAGLKLVLNDLTNRLLTKDASSPAGVALNSLGEAQLRDGVDISRLAQHFFMLWREQRGFLRLLALQIKMCFCSIQKT